MPDKFRPIKVLASIGIVFIVSSLALPPKDSALVLVLPLAAGAIVFFATMPRKAAVGAAPVDIPMAAQVRKTKSRMLMSALIFVALVAGGIAYSYYDQNHGSGVLSEEGVAAKAQEMLGPNFRVEYARFPNGVNRQETIANIVFSVVADGSRDSMTMILTGDCSDVCRIRMDPLDAVRLAPLR